MHHQNILSFALSPTFKERLPLYISLLYYSWMKVIILCITNSIYFASYQNMLDILPKVIPSIRNIVTGGSHFIRIHLNEIPHSAFKCFFLYNLNTFCSVQNKIYGKFFLFSIFSFLWKISVIHSKIYCHWITKNLFVDWLKK